MVRVRDAASAVIVFAWKTAVFSGLAALVVSVLFSEREGCPAVQGTDPIARSADGAEARVVLAVGPGRPDSTCVLEDGGGNELARVTYGRNGGVKIRCPAGTGRSC